jgi:hypothetical protein
MRNGHLAFWTLVIVTYFISLFFWPTPAVPLIGAVLVPVAIRAGLRAARGGLHGRDRGPGHGPVVRLRHPGGPRSVGHGHRLRDEVQEDAAALGAVARGTRCRRWVSATTGERHETARPRSHCAGRYRWGADPQRNDLGGPCRGGRSSAGSPCPTAARPRGHSRPGRASSVPYAPAKAGGQRSAPSRHGSGVEAALS